MLAFFVGLAAPVAPALALSQRGHVFAFSFMGSGSGELSAIAVNQSNGLVYVADRANNRVEVFEPERASPGAPVGERFVSSFSVPYPTSVAVDGSSDPSDASRGDIYVVGSTSTK